MAAEVFQPHVLPREGRGGDHSREAVVVDMEHAGRRQVREVLLVSFFRLQIHGRHGAATLRDARARVVAVDLDDVVLTIRGAYEAASLTRVRMNSRVVEDVADVGR